MNTTEEKHPNWYVADIALNWRHPDHKPNLSPDAKYVLREKGAVESFCGRNQEPVGSMLEARIYCGEYLNSTCWNWMCWWDAIVF